VSASSRKTRVLHVVGGLAAGGIETWLMQVLHHIDRDRFSNDFVVHTDEQQFYDEEAKSLGSRIFPVLSPSNPITYSKKLRALISEKGPYDVVHAHVAHFNGFVLRAAHLAVVPARIAHSHNDLTPQTDAARLLRRAYLRFGQRLIFRHATLGLACSDKAAISLFGEGWVDRSNIRIHHYGIDLTRFESTGSNRDRLLSDLDIPPNAKVVGHVGRFIKQKNHLFFVRIAEEMVQRDPTCYFLLVGGGELRTDVERAVTAAGIENNFRFAGLRSDIPVLMREAMDVFLLPSLHEGLPVVLLETQAAALPAVYSDVITKEIEGIPELLTQVGLDHPPSSWADHVLRVLAGPRPDQSRILTRLRSSSFNIVNCVKGLETLYSGVKIGER
jgi:glycosyltransferase involved in cell wall biosynthesis